MEQAARAALALLLILNSPAFATVTPIKKGNVATTDGFLFDHDSESQAEQNRTDADYYKKLADKQKEKIDLQDNESQILEKRLQLYIKESDTLVKARASDSFNEKLLLFGSFSLGAIVTALIVRNVHQ